MFMVHSPTLSNENKLNVGDIPYTDPFSVYFRVEVFVCRFFFRDLELQSLLVGG